jgi:Asp-tRNA(Asn)/Glu-tRNA(Gln) amidotransferase B subunit
MSITINNFNELLEFIKRDDITARQATEIVCKALRVVCLFEKTKDELIKDTEYHINKFCQNNIEERPIFLEQKNIEFRIKDIYKN